MKKILLLFLLSISFLSFAQQETEVGHYRLRNCINSQNTVFMKSDRKSTTLKRGWTITETVAGKTIQRTLTADTIVTYYSDKPIAVTSNWKIGEVKHTDEAPDKLYINPYHFTQAKDSALNKISYLKIPANGHITLIRSFVKWNAITIPFAIRPALNDTIGSKITTDLKIGASVSYNTNFEVFKNRRLKAKKSIYGFGAGIGFGFSKVTLDNTSTSLLDAPYVNSEDGLAFFVAPGLGLNLRGFQINFSYGFDIPITKNVNDWNYSNKGYIGIGLGVGLEIFGKI